MNLESDVITVNFLRPNSKISNTFIFPQARDISDVELSQIIRRLQNPTSLRRGGLKFDSNLTLLAYKI